MYFNVLLNRLLYILTSVWVLHIYNNGPTLSSAFRRTMVIIVAVIIKSSSVPKKTLKKSDKLVSTVTYSGDPITGLVWYSNGEIMSIGPYFGH